MSDENSIAAAKGVMDAVIEMSDRARGGKCPFCDDPDWEFKDALSVREYQISGLCQKCQDGFFHSEDDGQPDDLQENQDFAQDEDYEGEKL